MYFSQVCYLWLGILKLKSQKLFSSVFCLCVFCFLQQKWNHSPSIFLFLVIGSSFPLYALPLFFGSVNKAANDAWKWWEHSHAYRQTLSLLLQYERKVHIYKNARKSLLLVEIYWNYSALCLYSISIKYNDFKTSQIWWNWDMLIVMMLTILMCCQVYIRILDNEWNVYRRYTEFRELHSHLRAQFPQVDTFNFPPKKAIGNKVS